MTKRESDALTKKIMKAIEYSHKKMLKDKQARGEKLVIMRGNKIVTVSPEELM